MSDNNNSNKSGYGKPPKCTQFAKGQSGNPKGRPKGSQNLATLLAKIGRQRIKVTENGRSRNKSKLEAILVQLVNQALRGDIKATNELRYWLNLWDKSQQTGFTASVPHESDKSVMANILERIRNSDSLKSDTETDGTATETPEKEED